MCYSHFIDKWIGNDMNIEFGSRAGIDSLEDESTISEFMSDDWQVLFYAAPKFQESLIHFGGGVYDLTCRAVIALSNNKANQLCDLLAIRRTKDNIGACEVILNECRSRLNTGSYIAEEL